MHSSEQIIRRIIQCTYTIQKKALNLQGESEIWLNVLFYQDWNHLQKLYLQNCNIDDDTFSNFLCLCFPSLKILELRRNCIGNSFNLFFAKDYLCLEYLSVDLAHNLITYREFKQIKTSNLTSLKWLSIYGNEVGSRGIKHIVKCKLNLLECLDIRQGFCNIGDEGCKHLVKGKFNSLNQINLRYNNIKQNGFQQLSKTDWKKLKQISADDAQLVFLLSFIPVNWPKRSFIKSSQINMERLFRARFDV